MNNFFPLSSSLVISCVVDEWKKSMIASWSILGRVFLLNGMHVVISDDQGLGFLASHKIMCDRAEFGVISVHQRRNLVIFNLIPLLIRLLIILTCHFSSTKAVN